MNAQLRNTCIDFNYLLETRGGTTKALRVESTGSKYNQNYKIEIDPFLKRENWIIVAYMVVSIKFIF